MAFVFQGEDTVRCDSSFQCSGSPLQAGPELAFVDQPTCGRELLQPKSPLHFSGNLCGRGKSLGHHSDRP